LPSAGQAKLNLILNAAAAAWEVGQVEQSLSQNTTLNAISAMASIAVATLNATGVFKKRVAPPTPALLSDGHNYVRDMAAAAVIRIESRDGVAGLPPEGAPQVTAKKP
jgi:hypothetical protein